MKVSIDVAVPAVGSDGRSPDAVDGSEFAALLAGFAAMPAVAPTAPAPSGETPAQLGVAGQAAGGVRAGVAPDELVGLAVGAVGSRESAGETHGLCILPGSPGLRRAPLPNMRSTVRALIFFRRVYRKCQLTTMITIHSEMPPPITAQMFTPCHSQG